MNGWFSFWIILLINLSSTDNTGKTAPLNTSFCPPHQDIFICFSEVDSRWANAIRVCHQFISKCQSLEISKGLILLVEKLSPSHHFIQGGLTIVKGEIKMTKTNAVNYSICETVRTDGVDLYIDADALTHYLQTSHKYLRRLRERGVVYEGRPFVQHADNGKYEKKITITNFPSPILIKGRNYWKLCEIRGWEIENVRFVQHLNDMETVTRYEYVLQQIDDIETITQSVHDVVAVNAETLQNKLSSAKYDY